MKEKDLHSCDSTQMTWKKKWFDDDQFGHFVASSRIIFFFPFFSPCKRYRLPTNFTIKLWAEGKWRKTGSTKERIELANPVCLPKKYFRGKGKKEKISRENYAEIKGINYHILPPLLIYLGRFIRIWKDRKAFIFLFADYFSLRKIKNDSFVPG